MPAASLRSSSTYRLPRENSAASASVGTRALDPHDVGAHVGQQHPAERSRADAARLEHPDTVSARGSVTALLSPRPIGRSPMTFASRSACSSSAPESEVLAQDLLRVLTEERCRGAVPPVGPAGEPHGPTRIAERADDRMVDLLPEAARQHLRVTVDLVAGHDRFGRYAGRAQGRQDLARAAGHRTTSPAPRRDGPGRGVARRRGPASDRPPDRRGRSRRRAPRHSSSVSTATATQLVGLRARVDALRRRGRPSVARRAASRSP